jgi:Arc/MetJ-type ribon-helix-helix transcriptional regulator
MAENEVRINARVPRTLKKLMEQFVALDSHMNESDLIRDALREKIQRDAPDLYKRIFQEARPA